MEEVFESMMEFLHYRAVKEDGTVISTLNIRADTGFTGWPPVEGTNRIYGDFVVEARVMPDGPWIRLASYQDTPSGWVIRDTVHAVVSGRGPEAPPEHA
jgi:hypothetical protein